MAITDLLDRISFSTRTPGEPAAPPPSRPFRVELPRDGASPAPLADGLAGAPTGPTRPADSDGVTVDSRAFVRPAAGPARRPPLPSHGIAVIGGLTLLSLALAAALAMALGDAGPAAAAVPATAAPIAQAVPTPSFSAEPASIPVDLLTRLEDASEEPLDVELVRLLDAVQFGFGTRSAQLEPTLRSYVYRMSSRFEWNPDTFRVAVTAPDPDLAAARGALLGRLFEGATATGRLQVGTGTGPHALTLVSE